MGWGNFSLLVADARTYRYLHSVYYSRSGSSITAQASNPCANFWSAVGNGTPAKGAAPTLGLGGAVALSKATVGALWYPEAVSPKLTWPFSVVLTDETPNVEHQGVCMILIDRLAQARISIQEPTGSFSPVIDGTARLKTGEGAQIMVFCDTGFSNPGASNYVTWSLGYTDQDGNAATTPNCRNDLATVGHPAVGKLPFTPLAGGDSGARTITGWTFVSGTQTGNVLITLVRPIACFSGVVDLFPAEHDAIIQSCQLNEIRPDSCLDFIFTLGGTGTGQYVEAGLELKVLHG